LALIFLVVVQVAEIWRLITFSNRLLSRFFSAVKYDDYGQRFAHKNMGRSFENLTNSMNLVVKKLQDSKQLLEQQSLYLKTVLEHIETAVIVYDKQGEVSLSNRTARRLLQTNSLKNIHQLETEYSELSNLLNSIQSGQRNLCSCLINFQPHQLLVDMVEAKIENESVYIAAIQDIQAELDDKELKAWQDITKVLTHEISNSITPITSLANSCNRILQQPPDKEDLQDLNEAITTIERRGENLVQFIANYRKLTKVPKLNSKPTSINELIDHVLKLFEDKLKEDCISINRPEKDSDIQAIIDPILIEQVMVNLVKNAIIALDDCKSSTITIRLSSIKGRLKVQIEDNGKGILAAAQQRIFVPFYSTRSNGSGIGLSLSRLIMQLHNGTISVQSELGKGSCFTLLF